MRALTIGCLTTKHLVHGLFPDVVQTECTMGYGSLHISFGYKGSQGVSVES